MAAPYYKLDYLLAIFSDNKKQVEDVIRLFLEELPLVKKRLEAAWSHDNRLELRRAAHKIKSSLRAVGADMLADMALQLELQAETDKKKLEPIYNQLLVALPVLEDQLRQYLKSAALS